MVVPTNHRFFLELRIPSFVEHGPERLHLLLHHFRGGLMANERMGTTEAIPEVVYLAGLLVNERCGVGSGSPFSSRSQNVSCLGDRGIHINSQLVVAPS